MPANGRLSESQLRPLRGGGQLQPEAARAYNAFSRWLSATHHTELQHAGDGATYRPLGERGDYARGGAFTQWYAWERYQQGGNLAARPGTSNHGLGLAVDFTNHDVVRRYGTHFGWVKTEAWGEPWHYCYRRPADTRLIRQWSQVQIGDMIVPGDRGPGVVWVKRRLRQLGRWRWRINGNYGGPISQRAVRRFQRQAGLAADGIIGPATWRALRRAGR
jgi:hypothetical protein